MPDYPVRYLIPISAQMAYNYLLVVIFRLICSPFQGTTLFVEPVRSSIVGEDGSRYQLQINAVIIWVFTMFQPS